MIALTPIKHPSEISALSETIDVVEIKAGKKPPPSTHLGVDQNRWQRWRGKRTRYARSFDQKR